MITLTEATCDPTIPVFYTSVSENCLWVPDPDRQFDHTFLPWKVIGVK